MCIRDRAIGIQPDAAAEARLSGDQVVGRGGDSGHEPGVDFFEAGHYLVQRALAVLLGLESVEGVDAAVEIGVARRLSLIHI